MSIEKKKYECSALPKGWQREEVIRKSGLSAGKVDVYYYRYKHFLNTKKYHVFAPMGRFQLESIYLYFPPSSQ